MDPSGSFGADQAYGQSSEIEVLKDIPKPLNQLLTPNRNTVLHIHHTSPIKISEDSKSESSEPAQAEVNIGMKAKYYNGAANGEIGVFKDIGKHLDQLLTPNRNTVLHIYLTSLKESQSKDSKPKDSESEALKSNDSKSEDSESKDSNSKDSKPEDSKSPTAFVNEILRISPSLLWQANVKGETPLHIAARYGHAAIVAVLIKRARERPPQEDLENGVDYTVQKMLEMTNNEKDTALHEAVRGNHFEVVKRLIGEGPDFSYSQNKAGETPLYIAVERSFSDVALHILYKCKSLAHDGPLGRTTLHAAVIRNTGRFSSNTEMVETILQRIAPQEPSAFIKQVDKQGWTPLHCAAYFGSNYSTKELLKVDPSIAYMQDAKGMTALHIAAHKGHVDIMEDLLYYCPDCCELVDKRGWNALHFAVNTSNSYGFESYKLKDILNTSSLSNLLNEKDACGNTPLHHHSKSLHYIEDLMCHKGVDKMAFNNQNLNVYDLALTSEELSDKKFMKIRGAFQDECCAELRRPLEDAVNLNRKSGYNFEWKARKDRFVSGMKLTYQYHLVVDTIIATVAFTAGINMPGGFIGQEGPHPGSAVLTRNAAFKAFIITNALALVQSCSAAFIHLFMPLLFHEQNPGRFTFLMASLAFCLSISAMGAMVLTFVVGTYAVLMHSLGLAIANCVIGLCFFIPVFFVSSSYWSSDVTYFKQRAVPID
ncbi:hypothetical protein SO802_022081 [Lithocarpus litseifolius]|uniref:PGG domain-containing protein n=1 Tax=Lithocarpus litseifolius TaxID=425828 RepID=A0AAW2CLJ5_9ROSI